MTARTGPRCSRLRPGQIHRMDRNLPPRAVRIEQAREVARQARIAEGKPAEDPGDAEFRELAAQREKTAAFFARVARNEAVRRKRGR